MLAGGEECSTWSPGMKSPSPTVVREIKQQQRESNLWHCNVLSPHSMLLYCITTPQSTVNTTLTVLYLTAPPPPPVLYCIMPPTVMYCIKFPPRTVLHFTALIPHQFCTVLCCPLVVLYFTALPHQYWAALCCHPI